MLLVVIVMAFSSMMAWSQEATELLQRAELLKEMERRPTQKTLPSAHPLEEAVDPEMYVVGPGDVFSVTIWTAEEREYQANISPEGNLLVPSVGSIDVYDLTLNQAKEKISDAVAEKYASGDFTITLVALREFKVAVSGAVNNPGTVIVTATDRVSDAIAKAGGFVQEIAVSQLREQTTVETVSRQETISKSSKVKTAAALTSKEASRRNIKLRRRTGWVINVDLLSFMASGKKEANPYLLDGDVIFVPTREYEVGIVGIYGEVKVPGEYEFVPGDRVSDVVDIAHGLTIRADSAAAHIVRFDEDARTTYPVDLHLYKALQCDPEFDLPLRPDDRIYIRAIPDYHVKAQVLLEGEVVYPGEYSIKEGVTRLSDVVSQAGGFTKDASLSAAYVVRRAVEDIIDPEFERLKLINVADMTDQEREYFKIKSREKVGAMAVDFERVFLEGDEKEDVLLLDRDHVYVPAKGRTVSISGQVVRPGLIPHVPGADFQYYINEAGGYCWNARKSRVRVIKARTGEWLKPGKDVEIEVGDTLFVPEKPERDYWQLFKDVMLVSAQIAAIFLVIQNASN
jgi:protein involved in polysaccharide export with SLBB domain